MTERVDAIAQAAALAAASHAAAEQRASAATLRDAVTACRTAGVSWADIGRAIGIPRETVFRQYEAGSGIVVVHAVQAKGHP